MPRPRHYLHGDYLEPADRRPDSVVYCAFCDGFCLPAHLHEEHEVDANRVRLNASRKVFYRTQQSRRAPDRRRELLRRHARSRLKGDSAGPWRYSWSLARMRVALADVARSSPGNEGAKQSHLGGRASEGRHGGGRALRREPRARLPHDGRGRRVRPGDLRHLRRPLSATREGPLNSQGVRLRVSVRRESAVPARASAGRPSGHGACTRSRRVSRSASRRRAVKARDSNIDQMARTPFGRKAARARRSPWRE